MRPLVLLRSCVPPPPTPPHQRKILNVDVGTVCTQKERYIQVSRVDDDERKRREQQKLEKEQVGFRGI